MKTDLDNYEKGMGEISKVDPDLIQCNKDSDFLQCDRDCNTKGGYVKCFEGRLYLQCSSYNLYSFI